MTRKRLLQDSSMQSARIWRGTRPMRPPFPAVSRNGIGGQRDRTFDGEDCA